MPGVRASSASEWATACSAAFVPLKVRATAPEFTAVLAQLDLGLGVTVTKVSSEGSLVYRDAGVIAESPRDDVILSLHRSGRGAVVQHGREAPLRRGDAAVYDASVPYRLRFPGRMSELVLQVPRRTIARTGHAFDELTARVLPASSGLTALTSLMIAVTSSGPAESRPAEGETLADAAATLLHAALLPLGEPVTARIGTSTLAAVIRVYIDEHLTDSDLGVDKLAAAHHVSARLVHRVFAETGETPAAFIRRRRLALARTLVSGGASVTGVALRVGFGDPDTFTRAFKREFGHPPSQLLRAGSELARTIGHDI